MNSDDATISQKISKLSRLQEWMLQLSAPYKESEAFEIFENQIERNNQIPRQSTFWDTRIRYVVKYQNDHLETFPQQKDSQKVKKR